MFCFWGKKMGSSCSCLFSLSSANGSAPYTNHNSIRFEHFIFQKTDVDSGLKVPADIAGNVIKFSFCGLVTSCCYNQDFILPLPTCWWKAVSNEYAHSNWNVSSKADLDVNMRKKMIGREEYSFYLWVLKTGLARLEIAQGVLTKSRWKELSFLSSKFSLFGGIAGQCSSIGILKIKKSGFTAHI